MCVSVTRILRQQQERMQKKSNFDLNENITVIIIYIIPTLRNACKYIKNKQCLWPDGILIDIFANKATVIASTPTTTFLHLNLSNRRIA